ncbi:MAG: LysR substrate-binding domain-containing protein [Methylophilaceae bacterium]
MMELRTLRYFVKLAEHLHFSLAAEALDIAPSALSMQLQGLEKELGVKLVARTKRSVSLTGAGELFLVEAKATLQQAEQSMLIAKRAGRGEIGKLEVGFVMSAACSGIVQKLLSAYRLQYPYVQVNLQALESPLQIQLLEQGKLDACIVRNLYGNPDLFEHVTLLNEPIVAALSNTHPLARKANLKAIDLAQEAFIAPQFERDFGFNQHILAIGEKAGFTPRFNQRTKDFITTLTLVASGFGVAAVPQSVSALPIPGIAFRPFSDVTERSELMMLFRRHDTAPTIAHLRALAELLASQETSPAE